MREEIVKRIELEYQLINLSLITFGVICGVSLQNKSPLVIMVYPFFAAFIVAGWVNSDNSIQCIAQYIKSHIETTLGENNTGWEHRFEFQRSDGLSALSVGGTFVGTSLFAILVGISLVSFDATEVLLLIMSGISLIFSFASLLWYFYKSQKNAKAPIK